MTHWTVGWDPSRNGYHALVVTDEDQEIIVQGKRKGLKESLKLLAYFETLAIEADKKLIVGIEYSHPELTEQIHEAGFHDIYELNARKVHGYKDSCLSEDKTDEIDAYACACYLLHNRKKLKRYQVPSPLEKRARIIAAELDSLRDLKTQAWERFWAVVDRGSPEIKTLLENKEVGWFLALFTDLLAKMKHTGYKAFTQFCRRRGARFGDEVLKPLYLQMKELARIINPRLPAVQAKLIGFYLEEIGYWEEEAAATLADWEDAWILLSVKGIAPPTAIRLLAILGQDWHQWTLAKVAKLGGLAPVLRGSGIPTEREFLRMPKHKRKRMRIKRYHRNHCNKRLKTTLCLFALFSMKHHTWAHLAYQRMRQRGQGHWEALRNLAMKWLKILLALMEKKEAYDIYHHQRQIAVRTDPLMQSA